MDKKQKIQSIRIAVNASILAALKKMDKTFKRLLLVFDNNQFINVLSIGDIQRAIIRNQSLDTEISEILRKETRVAKVNDSFDFIKSQMLKYKAECMPVIDDNNQLVDVHFWEDIFSLKVKRISTRLELPVVIMAGGRGQRLKPLTNIIPKPLIPLGDKTILEDIMDRFLDVGCKNFYLSVNYKSETIKHYFAQMKNHYYNIEYIQEEKPLGTAGSLHLIKDKIDQTFFITNCDILIDEDYGEILKYHKENKNEITIVSAIKYFSIPYGVVETKRGGVLESLKEKPELTFQINSGMYIMEPHVLDEIPENRAFDFTDLMVRIRKKQGRIGVFPVNAGSWTDIGELNEYFTRIKNIRNRE